MTFFRITKSTTNEQIAKATKEDLICAVLTGHAAPLRQHRRKTWTKADAIRNAIETRDRLLTESR